MSIVVVSLCAIAALAAAGSIGRNSALAMIGGGSIVALAGWLDDLRSLRPALRAGAHFIAAIWAVSWLGGFPALGVGHATLQLGAAGAVLAVLGIVWAINLYNFMDGIDGLAGVEAVTAGLAGGALLAATGHRGLALLAIAIAGASAGFLRWNWPPARIFMGDVGSGFLGFQFAVVAIASEKLGGVQLLVWVMILGVFVLDATFTLARRFFHRERVFEPHARHAYQRATRFYGGHSAVTRRVLGINLVLAGVAATAVAAPGLLPAAFIAALSLLLALYLTVERLKPMWETRP